MTQRSAANPESEQQPVLVLMGVSGTGKSTVAALLVEQLGWNFQEGDDLHPAANVDKMHAGIALTDEDRRPWLEKVGHWIDEHLSAGEPGIVSCSALRRRYRDVLRRPAVVFVHLTGSHDLIARRIAARRDHFMPPELLQSQFATLEPPGADENALSIDVALSPNRQAAEVVERLRLRPRPGPAPILVAGNRPREPVPIPVDALNSALPGPMPEELTTRADPSRSD